MWIAIATGVLVIVLAALLRPAAPYWVSWAVNAIGWICIALAVFAFSDRQRESHTTPNDSDSSASGQAEKIPVVQITKNLTGGNNMRYGLAIIACAGVWFIYGLIGAMLDWKNAGGIIPVLILMAVTGMVWRSITSTSGQTGKDSGMKSDQ